ncbi:MAG TPA: hypothetical protein VM753_09200 [Anaeromyxobacter sp.]|jgi:hypothetical protein|nr:hypothetical protein [Anaeromyxobacter sp.]
MAGQRALVEAARRQVSIAEARLTLWRWWSGGGEVKREPFAVTCA